MTPGVAADTIALRVQPEMVVFQPGETRRQIAVTQEATDGLALDRTNSARYRVEPAEVAEVSATGLIIPRRNGRATLHVEVDGQFGSSTIQVVDLERSRRSSYRLDVAALLSKAGCNAGTCHGNIHGKGGFRLSLRGDDPAFDLLSMTRDTFGRRLDRSEPARSLLLLKPTGQVPHEGGLRFAFDSPEATTLVDWVASGAGDDLATVPKLLKLEVFPPYRVAPSPSLRQQLVVMATFADGSSRDVTRQASYDLNDPTQVSVSTDGLVEAKRPIETTVSVRYLNGRGVSRLAFLPERLGFVWREVPVNNVVDRQVFAKLKAHKLQPSELASDAAFLRRATLDALGVLPTSDEARIFLADPDPNKRAKLVDRLLDRPEFADFWALKWADLLRNEEKTMGPKGVWVFQRWLRDQVAADVPLDLFVRKLITSTGSTYSNPPSSFYRTNRDPLIAAETFSQVFLGIRLQCARCHNHPYDSWTQDDYYGLAAYFNNIRRKQINNNRVDNLDVHEIKGDEVVFLNGPALLTHPRSGELLTPKPLAGSRPNLSNTLDAREDLARWLTVDSPQFSRNMANRVWFHLLGRGIVDPVEDFRESNPPSNPALLDTLASELVNHGYRLKPLVALIMKSRTYGLDARPNESNVNDEINFAHATVRLLPAEVLIDAICQVFEKPETYDQAPRSARSVQMPGVNPGGSFLKTFGKPDRLLTCECERSEATTLAQALQLINGESIRSKLIASDNRIGRLIRSNASDDAILDEISLVALGHEFDTTRRSSLIEYVARSADRRKAWEDVTWAILNSKEFLLRH